MMEGKGFGLPQYFTHNTIIPVYDHTPYWPPGYPTLLAPYLKIFNYNVYWATTAFDITFSVILIFLVRKIAAFMNFSKAAINIVTLIIGCFEYTFISASLPTDIPSFVLFLSGFLLIMQAIQSNQSQMLRLVLGSIFLFMSCTIRYSYPPLTICIPVLMVLAGLYYKRPLLIKKGIIVLSITTIAIISFLSVLKISTGTSGYIIETGRGFFPQNLIHWAPVGPSSFINISFLLSQTLDKTTVSLKHMITTLEIINFTMVVVFVATIFWLFFKKNFFKEPDSFKWFILLGFFVTTATFIELGYLSLTYKSQHFNNSWNYINESRYYAFPFIYLQLIFIGWIFLYPNWKKNLFQKSLIFILGLLLFVETSHNLYFHTKVISRFSHYKTSRYVEADYAYFNSLFSQLTKDNPGTELFVAADNDQYYPLYASFKGHKGIFDESSLNKELPIVKKKTILIVVLYDEEINKYQEFLSNKNIRLLNSIVGVNFYSLILNPSKF